MTKNTSKTDEVPKASEVPRSERETSVSSLLDPQDSTDTPVAPTQPSQTPADSTQSGPTVGDDDDESEENKSYVRGYNEALADVRGARRASAPQAPRSPKAPRSSQAPSSSQTPTYSQAPRSSPTPNSTGFCPFHEIWYGEDSEDDDGENVPGHPNFMRAHREQMRQHSEHMQQLGNRIRASMSASPRPRRTRRSQYSWAPTGLNSSSGRYQDKTENCSCCDCDH